MEMGDNRLPRNNGEYHHHSVNGTSPKMKQEAQWKLYEAYNEFHSLAQKSSIPFDAPAVLVVGHQTEGKSALIEALTGFQFNHVGEGTKTRRPITIHMKFNPDCGSPLYYLYSDSDPSIHHEKTLEQIQEYIEGENMRLENEPYQFSSKEIIIRTEYKYCPNLTIIDTPGLVAPALARKNLALQNQAWALESFLREKMKHKEFIIMCLKDCSDWSNTTAQRIVMQIDPELSRTVVVSTKLDTKIPKFARASDAEVFLSPPSCTRGRFMLGDSPFFTSVPSGRVGLGHESVFESNDEFKQAVSSRESDDLKALEEKLGRSLSERERSRIGVSSLKSFLEELLQRRYMDSVPLIIPLLEKEYRSINKKLNKIRQEHSCLLTSTLDGAKLKEKGRSFTNLFLTKLSLLLKGTVVAPPDKFGETLQDERVNGGAFTGTDGLQFPQKLIPNAGIRLYGGAQYHRAMAEFRFVVGRIECPPITREEMVNACGVEDIHDGTNYSRTACVIAVSKARDTFEPFLHQLGGRLLHILKRLLPISVFLLQRDGEYLRSYEVFLKRAASAFNKFAESTEKSCREKCMEDLTSTTRYVSWSLRNKNQAGLRQFLDSFGGVKLNELAMGNDSNGGVPRTDSRLPDLVDGTLLNRRLRPSSERIDYALARKFFHGIKEYFLGSGANEKQESKSGVDVKLNKLALGNDSNGSMPTTETRVTGLLDSTLWNRSLEPSSERMVNALVRQIFHGIREYFLTSAEMKFNCLLLMPVVDKLPAILHEDLGFPFEDDDSVFDIACFPHLSTEEQETEIELELIQRLKEKFQRIHYSIRPC